MRCAALLGSINVGGNRVKMAELRDALDKGGLLEVTTVAASGNILFTSSESDCAGDEGRIAAIVARNFGIACLVRVCSLPQLRAALAENPFHGSGSDRMVHTVFLTGKPTQEAFASLLAEHRARGSERLALGDRMLFIDYIHGVGVSDLTGRFIERRLGFRGTARNMTSLKRIIAKMEETG